MSKSRLVNKTVSHHGKRTSMRLEPELWAALGEIARREHRSIGEIYSNVTAGVPPGRCTSAMRVFIFNYFRAAVTELGHIEAGHGPDRGPEAHTEARRHPVPLKID